MISVPRVSMCGELSKERERSVEVDTLSGENLVEAFIADRKSVV